MVREGSRRVLGLRPFDVQLIGGMILHEGQIAEMRTGEGKTLVAVLPGAPAELSARPLTYALSRLVMKRRSYSCSCSWPRRCCTA